jgi:hypothetical protein
MSMYTRVRTKIVNRSALLRALKNLGFKEHMVEVSDTPMSLKGYRGDDRQQRAHIRIKGSGWGQNSNYVGGASNDLGWEMLEDGTFAFHVSDYDVNKYNQGWQKRLTQQYAKEVITEIAEENKFFVEDIAEENGEIFMQVVSPF